MADKKVLWDHHVSDEVLIGSNSGVKKYRYGYRRRSDDFHPSNHSMKCALNKRSGRSRSSLDSKQFCFRSSIDYRWVWLKSIRRWITGSKPCALKWSSIATFWRLDWSKKIGHFICKNRIFATIDHRLKVLI